MQVDEQHKSPIPYGLVVPVYMFLAVLGGFNSATAIRNTLSSEAVAILQVSVVSEIVTKQPPTSIVIPKIDKDLPIQAAVVKNNEWQLFDTSVAWLSTSAIPGEGNVILYAHNWNTLWGDLDKLQQGDEILLNQNGKAIRYLVTESRTVLPTDIDAILSEHDQLTLYTCEGVFDQKRRVVYAKPAYTQL